MAQVNLALSRWELANLHLPPVTTVTFYSGTAPVPFLRHRIALILEKNPWLTSRIVKRSTADGIVAVAYDGAIDADEQVDEHFRVYEPGEVCLTLDMQYAALVECLRPLQCARSKPATDANEPLFKVAVVPLEASTDSAGPAPMESKVTLPGFPLIVSMNHTMGDGHTYYRLYGMLDAGQDVEALDPARVSGFEEAKNKQPRGKPRGISKQHELVIPVYLLIFLALLIHVPPYQLLVAVLTHCAGNVSVSPKFPTP